MHCNHTKCVLLIAENMHTYTWARPHSVTWKEANLACRQDFALQWQLAVNRIIYIWEQLQISLSPSLSLSLSLPSFSLPLPHSLQ